MNSDPSGSRKPIKLSAIRTNRRHRRLAALDDRRQVGQVPGARVSDLDTLAGLRQAARVDRREHIGCEIDRGRRIRTSDAATMPP